MTLKDGSLAPVSETEATTVKTTMTLTSFIKIARYGSNLAIQLYMWSLIWIGCNLNSNFVQLFVQLFCPLSFCVFSLPLCKLRTFWKCKPLDPVLLMPW